MAVLSLHRAVLDDPGRAAPLARAMLGSARDRSLGILCTYTLAGDVLALGRYHVVPNGGDDVRILRRTTGGRPAPLGSGFGGMVLALPHGGALMRDDPPSLPAERILNRAVRGILGAMESLGAQAYYPGRDLVTAGGRTIAALGIEVAPEGGVIVEGAVALARSYAEVTRFADRADPSGVVPIDLVTEEQATSLAQATGRACGADEWIAALAAGYASRLGLDVEVGDDLVAPPADPAWLDAGRLAVHLDRHAATRDVLGVVEVYAAIADGRLRDVRVCGDLIAPAATVARLEAALRAAPLDRATLRRVAAESVPEGLLGVRSTATIGDLVAEACGA